MGDLAPRSIFKGSRGNADRYFLQGPRRGRKRYVNRWPCSALEFLRKIRWLMILRNAQKHYKTCMKSRFLVFWDLPDHQKHLKNITPMQKTLCHKRRFSTVLKASKLMILSDAKNVIKPVWNQCLWCFGTSRIVKTLKKRYTNAKKCLLINQHFRPSRNLPSWWF